MTGRPAVFLDRDGVLVVPEFRDGRSYAPTQLEKLVLYQDAAPALEALKAEGYLLVVVTNQPDINAGKVPAETVAEMHRRLKADLPVDAVYMCPHTRTENCDCRKPAAGMLRQAGAKFGIDLDSSFMIGDRVSDVEAGRSAGCRTIFIDLGYTSEPRPQNADWTVFSISEAASLVLELPRKDGGT